MSVLIYRFDCLEAFPVIGALSSPGAVAEMSLVGAGDAAFLDVSITRSAGATGPLEVALALPPRTVMGTIQQLELVVAAHAGACQVAVELEEASAGIRRLLFDFVDLSGSPGYTADVAHGGVGTFQFHRFSVSLPGSCASARLGLVSLSYVGEARFASSGLAR